MRRKVLYCTLLCSTSVHALTLQEAYQASLTKMERIAVSKAEVERSEKEYTRRLAVIYPTLSLKASEFVQDVPPGSSSNVVESTFVRRSTPQSSIELKHTFFTYLKEYAALHQLKNDIAQRKLESTRAGEL